MSISQLFAEAREEFRSYEKLFNVALDVEVAKLDFALHELSKSVVRTEHRLKDFVSIRDNYLKHFGTPNHEVSFEEFLTSCSDLIGLRVVTLYNADLEVVEDRISSTFGLKPESRIFNEKSLRKGSEFGYRATHWKYEVTDAFVRRQLSSVPITAEIQIRSVLSDAWARHSHSLYYKSGEEPSDHLIREFGIASATIEGLDNQLDSLFATVGAVERRPYTEEAARASLASALTGIVGEKIQDGEIDTLVSLLEMSVSDTTGSYDSFISDAKQAWEAYSGKDFGILGAQTAEQRLKVSLFGFNPDLYGVLISPHMRKRTTDILAGL